MLLSNGNSSVSFLCERTRQTFRLLLMSSDDYQKLALLMADTFDVSIF